MTSSLATILLIAAGLAADGPADGADGGSWASWIPSGQIEDALRFDHPGVPNDAQGYSAAFYGPGPGLRWTLLNARRASATLGLGDLASWLRGLFTR